jgi:hypothetical protein
MEIGPHPHGRMEGFLLFLQFFMYIYLVPMQGGAFK